MKKFLSYAFFFVGAILAFTTNAFGHEAIATGITTAFFFPAAVTADSYRKFYKAINAAAASAGILASPGDLRSEFAVQNSKSVYSFTIRDIQMDKTTFPQSQGVEDNDLFVVLAHGIFWDNRVSGTGKIQLQTYPNPFAAAAAGITTADLYALYSGQFNVQVGSTEFIKQLDSSAFLTIPEAQQTSATDNTQFDIYAALKGLGAYPIYSGKADNKVTLTINTSPSLSIEGNTGQTVLTYFCKGIVLNNGANKQGLYEAVLESLGRI